MIVRQIFLMSLPISILNWVPLCVLIFSSFFGARATELENDESLRKVLFKNTETPLCKQISISPSGIVSLTVPLNEFILKTMTALKEKNYSSFEALFHPKLNFKRDYISEIFSKIESTYGPKYDSSIYRLWALNTVDGTPLTLECEDPHVFLHALYGYNLQFVLWIQLMGNELGRIYLPIVNAKGNWYIGGLHAQQWTHESKNFQDWAKIAEISNQKGDKLAAYFEYDLAKKLGFGDRFFTLKQMEKIQQEAEKNLSQEAFEREIKSALPSYPVAYASPLFVKGGVGLLIRLNIPKEISLIEIKSRCQKIKDEIKTKPWTKNLSAIRCSFLLPQEKSTEEGALGGILLNL